MGRDHAGFGSPFALARRARRRGPKWNSEATDLRSADRATWDLIDKQWTPRCSATLTYFLGRLYAHECSVEQHVIAPRQAGCNRISPLDVPGSGRYTAFPESGPTPNDQTRALFRSVRKARKDGVPTGVYW